MQPGTALLSISKFCLLAPSAILPGQGRGQCNGIVMFTATVCRGERTCTNRRQEPGKKWVQGPEGKNGTNHGQDRQPNSSHNNVGHLLVLLKAEVSA